MPNWTINLQGDEVDLKDLTKLFDDSELTIENDEDSYCLKSSNFDAMTEAEEVLSHGAELVAIANGIAKLRFKDFQNVRTGEVIRNEGDGTSRHHLFRLHHHSGPCGRRR